MKPKIYLKNLLNESLEAYYWIGFIMADGSFYKSNGNYRLKICLHKMDKNHLIRFCAFLGLTSDRVKEYGDYCEVSVMDNSTIVELKNKFGLPDRKTYNPPTKKLKLNNKMLSLYLGIIDGDGNIRANNNRNDIGIQIKMHSSWLPFLIEMKHNIYNYFNEKFMFPNKGVPYLRKDGYALFCLSSNVIIKGLKRFSIYTSIPVLDRKWNIVDLDREDKYEISKSRMNKITTLKNKGKSIKEIAKLLNMSYSGVYMKLYRKKEVPCQK